MVALLLAALAVQAYLRRRPTPAERERRRRAAIHLSGKIGDASVQEAGDHALIYSYEVRGVTYTVGQEISGLQQFLPGDLAAALGPAAVKYDPKNPADSIVLCEEWSGLTLPNRSRS